MNEHNSIYLVYNFKPLKSDNATYNIVYLLNAHGEVDSDLVSGTLNKFGMSSSIDRISFQTKEDMETFSKSLVDDMGMKQIYMLSVTDLNIGIESSHDIHGFKEVFHKYASVIEGTTTSAKAKTFMDRIFN